MLQPSIVENLDSDQLYNNRKKQQNTTSLYEQNHGLTFIDLFAGIGGFHLALHNLNSHCVFASEIDTHARNTYQANFNKRAPNLFTKNLFNEDITKIPVNHIPNFDILCAGFPCQPFSQAGLKLGFADTLNGNRGNLFFNIAAIINTKQPKSFILENVRHLMNHDEGKTFDMIKRTIASLGYSCYYQILKASDYGVPQHRPRIFIVGFKNDILHRFQFPTPVPLVTTMSHILQGECNKDIGFTLRVGGKGSKIDDRRNWEHYYVNDKIVKIEVSHAKQMQGFPSDYLFPVSQTQAMKQLGNSVAIPVVQAVATQVINYILRLKNRDNT